MEIKNKTFMIGDGYIEFSFNEDERAFLQLPNTGDSIHLINGKERENWTEKEEDIFKQLSEYYFNSFNENGCAAASAELGTPIAHIENVEYKNHSLYVAFDVIGKISGVLIDSPYKNYYNKRNLFNKLSEHQAYDMFKDDYNESEVIEIAKKQWKKESEE